VVCNVCGKNEATIHLTEILNNQMIEIHLCENCSVQKGSDFKSHFNVNQLLANLGEFGGGMKAAQAVRLICKGCSMTYEEFAKSGRLGCPDCYVSFEKQLLPLLKRIQRQPQHTGKIPKKTSDKIKKAFTIRELHEKLQKNIQAEAYEEAAQIRDQIRQVEEKIKKEKESSKELPKKSKS